MGQSHADSVDGYKHHCHDTHRWEDLVRSTLYCALEFFFLTARATNQVTGSPVRFFTGHVPIADLAHPRVWSHHVCQ